MNDLARNRLTEIFDAAMLRTEETLVPINGWFEKLQDSFHYRFRVETADLTSFQKYYHEGRYIGCIFDFTENEKDNISFITKTTPINANAFYIAPNTSILPHTDNSPKRSFNCTVINLSGEGSILKLYNNSGDVVFELPKMVDQYTFYPKKIIHSYDVKDIEAKLINIWHS